MTARCFPPFSTARLAPMLTVEDELFIHLHSKAWVMK
jgi:hypothetical protein